MEERVENCAVTYLIKWPKLIGWLDVNCNDAYQWLCEKIYLSQREKHHKKNIFLSFYLLAT